MFNENSTDNEKKLTNNINISDPIQRYIINGFEQVNVKDAFIN